MNFGRVGEFHWLAEKALENAEEELGGCVAGRLELLVVREQLALAERHSVEGDMHARAEAVMKAHAAAVDLWRGSGWPWY
jgi:hypothetical protein